MFTQHVECCHVHVAGVVHRDTLYLVGNLQSPDPEERPALPTGIAMCCFHFPSQQWSRLRLAHAPEVCHYPLLAAQEDQLILFGGRLGACQRATQASLCMRVQFHDRGCVPKP